MVKRAKRVLLAGMIFLLSHSLFAQTHSEFHALIRENPIVEKKSPAFQASPSEMKTTILAALRLYQIFVATQDMPVCNFTPSCSHFAQEAFRNVSPFKALLLASDRLLRDNPWVAGQYPINPKTGRFSDPLDFYLKLLKKPAKHAKSTKRKK